MGESITLTPVQTPEGLIWRGRRGDDAASLSIVHADPHHALDALLAPGHSAGWQAREQAAVEAARAEGYQAGRMAERAALRNLLREAIDKENDDRTCYEREAARLEAQAKSARDCALASHFRADGLAVMLDRVETAAGDADADKQEAR